MFFVSSRRRHTRCALVTGVQTCALPISSQAGSLWPGALACFQYWKARFGRDVDDLSLRVFEVVDVEVAKVALGTAKALSHDAVGLGYTFRADDLGVCFHLGAVAFRHCGADSNLAVPFGLGETGRAQV